MATRMITITCDCCGCAFTRLFRGLYRQRFCSMRCNYIAKTIPPLDRFLTRVTQQTSGCWLWTGYLMPNGYGKFAVSRGINALAHRWSYETFVGAIPAGLTLDHLCRVRGCVNPTHLEPVTRRENV